MELLRTLLIAILLVGCALMAHGHKRPGGWQGDERPDNPGTGPHMGGPPVCGFVLEGKEDVPKYDCPKDDLSCSVKIDFTIEGVNAQLSLCARDDDDRVPPRAFGLFRSACLLTNDTLEQKNRACPGSAACNRGPVEITVDGNALSGMFCASDLTWYSIFSSPPPRRGRGGHGVFSSGSSDKNGKGDRSGGPGQGHRSRGQGSGGLGGGRGGERRGGMH